MQVWEGTFLLPQKFRQFWLEIKMKHTIFWFGPTRIFETTCEGGPLWLVQSFWSFRPECPSSAHLYCVSLTSTHTIFKCVVAWIGTVQPEYTLPLDMWNFQNFKLDYFWNGKCPEFLLVRLSDMLVKHLSPY